MTDQRMPVADVVVRDDLYPRMKTDPALIQQYADNLELLPPIEINQHRVLIDGMHRLTAHRSAGVTDIAVSVTETASDGELLLLACRRNATHGYQLSRDDKQRMARQIYHTAANADRPALKKQLAEVLSVTPRTMQNWLDYIDKDAAAETKAQAYAMWLSFRTQQEIADALGVASGTAANMANEFLNFGNFSKIEKSAAEFHDWEGRTFGTTWQWKGKTNAVDHPGSTEQEIVERLIRMYTQPFEGVVDPFAGGGPTIDICQKRHRRYWCSDLAPSPVRDDIRQHDIMAGMPRVPDWQNTRLVYLDPPYWKQAFDGNGKSWYGDDPHNLANLNLDEFHKALADIVLGFADKLYIGAKIALIIAPTQWRSPSKPWPIHHAEAVRDLIKASRRPMRWRVIQCPYPLAMYNQQMMAWERENNEALENGRELTIWEV